MTVVRDSRTDSSDLEVARRVFADEAAGLAAVAETLGDEFIKALDCPVTVLHEGHVLAEGTLDQVQTNEQVIEVYLGR